MKLLRSLIIAACLPVLSINAQTAKLKLVKGQKYEVSSTTNVNSIASVMGQEMETIANTITVEKYEIKDTRPTETDLTTTITKMIVNTSAMGQEMNYDSEKKNNSGPGAEELDKQIGKVKTMTIDANGKIIKESKDETEAPSNVMMGGGKSGLPLVIPALFGKEIKTGATWYDSTTVITEKITTTTAGDYTITVIDPATSTFTITFNGTTRVTGTMEQMGQEMEMKSTSKVTGTTDFDMNTGVIKKTSTTTDGTMTIEAGGMSIPVTVKSTTTSTIKQL